MKRKHAFTPTVDGRLEARLALNAASAPAERLAAPFPRTGNAAETVPFPFEATLTTGAYNSILVNIHNATGAFGRSRGTDRDYIRLNHDVSRQLERIPYARFNGLTRYVRSSLELYSPEESRELYRDIRSTLISYLAGEVAADHIRILRPSGRFFSDADIFGPGTLTNPPPTSASE